MINWLKSKSDIIALGLFVVFISGLTIISSSLILVKTGFIENSYTKTEVLLICARAGLTEKECRI